ncbi:unnamed protein product [Discosporangium mesarthrocarpum]
MCQIHDVLVFMPTFCFAFAQKLTPSDTPTFRFKNPNPNPHPFISSRTCTTHCSPMRSFHRLPLGATGFHWAPLGATGYVYRSCGCVCMPSSIPPPIRYRVLHICCAATFFLQPLCFI